MFKKLALVLVLVPAIALAQAVTIPTAEQIAAEKVACEKKYNPDAVPSNLKVSIALAQELCKGQVDMRVLEAKAQAAGSKNQAIEKELERQRASLEAIAKSLKALESAKVEPKSASVQPEPPASAGAPVMMAPPPQVIAPPGRYFVSVVPVQGMVSPIQIHNLSRGARYWVGDNQEVRMEFVKNGKVLPGPPDVFELFYSPNKKGPPTPHRGVDPAFVSSVFTSCQMNDDLQVIYYVWDGEYVNGTAYPAWKRVGKVQFANFGPRYNKWQIDATSGVRTP